MEERSPLLGRRNGEPESFKSSSVNRSLINEPTSSSTSSSGRFDSQNTFGSVNGPLHNNDLSSSSPGLYTDDDPDDYELSTTEDSTILQAVVFIEDAVRYRSCHHKLDEKTVKLYRLYYSTPVQAFIYFIIFLLHMLAFFERPSSIVENWTSDVRYNQGKRWLPPCGLTESIELLCLLVLAVDVAAKSYFIGLRQARGSPWLLGYIFIISISIVDWCVTLSYGCGEVVRIRRMLRPFFIIQNSSLMKKTINCLRRTIPQVVSVLLLLALHIYFFTLLGMLLFPKAKVNGTDYNSSESSGSFKNLSNNVITEQDYFITILDSFISLLVLLTTANNPDITMPAYRVNRMYAIYFVVFLLIGLYCFMNMLTAVIFNQFRGYFQDSIQSSLFRRRVGIRAAFEVLRRKTLRYQQMSSSTSSGLDFRSPMTVASESIPAGLVRSIVDKTNLRRKEKSAIHKALAANKNKFLDAVNFQDVFCVLEKNYNTKDKPLMVWTRRPCLNVLQTVVSHKWFTLFGCAVAIVNVICISIINFAFSAKRKVELDGKIGGRVEAEDLSLGITNLVFIVYYLIEMCLKIWALGWRLYMWDIANVFDGFITIVLVVIECIYLTYGSPFMGTSETAVVYDVDAVISLWDLVRIINILILVRMFRIITAIKTMSMVANTLLDLIRNLKPFGGILVVLYYSYAILGMELFEGVIMYPSNATNISYKCGSYEQLEYWANNFDDFASSLIVLWDIMVVNNWHVFLKAYSTATTPWSMIYFIVWWLLSVILVLNLFTALILENFIMRWDQKRDRSPSGNEYNESLSVHDMFRGGLREPAENEILLELRHHRHLTAAR